MPWAAAGIGSYALHSAVASFVLYHLLCASVALVYHRRFGPREHRPLPIHRWAAIAGVCLLVCLGAYVAVGYLGWLINPAHVRAGLHEQHLGTSIGAFAALYAYFAIVNPIAEEFFWRGSIYLGLRAGGWRVAKASFVTAILFGSWHWLIVRLFFSPEAAAFITVGIIAVGWAFAHLYERSHSIPLVILVHALGADVPILVALWAAVMR